MKMVSNLAHGLCDDHRRNELDVESNVLVITVTPVLVTGTSPVVSLQTTNVYCIPVDSDGKSNG